MWNQTSEPGTRVKSQAGKSEIGEENSAHERAQPSTSQDLEEPRCTYIDSNRPKETTGA